jgi:hypothetical protein
MSWPRSDMTLAQARFVTALALLAAHAGQVLRGLLP